jgi:hypothetical protein
MTNTQSPPPKPSLLKRIANGMLAVIAALWLFVEEWLWDNMLALMAWLAKLPPIRWCEAQLAKLPPYAALIAFLIPVLLLLPFKFFAFWLIAKGHQLMGVQLFIIAKLVGTALLARVFTLTKPQLLTITWFARAYYAIIGWKARLYAYAANLPLTILLRKKMLLMKRWLRAKWVTIWG